MTVKKMENRTRDADADGVAANPVEEEVHHRWSLCGR